MDLLRTKLTCPACGAPLVSIALAEWNSTEGPIPHLNISCAGLTDLANSAHHFYAPIDLLWGVRQVVDLTLRQLLTVEIDNFVGIAAGLMGARLDHSPDRPEDFEALERFSEEAGKDEPFEVWLALARIWATGNLVLTPVG